MKKIGNSIIQSRKKIGDFDEKIEIRERCKGVHCVDLGEGFPTSIYLQNLASIQLKTGPDKFLTCKPHGHYMYSQYLIYT